MGNEQTVTLLLRELADGDQAALDRLIPLVYDELRRIARGQLRRERPGHTLQPTALVNEVYARMLGQEQPDYRDRAHFLSIAARAMRKILIDYARGHKAEKRGGGQPVLQLDEALNASGERPMMVVALDDALTALEKTGRPKGPIDRNALFRRTYRRRVGLRLEPDCGGGSPGTPAGAGLAPARGRPVFFVKFRKIPRDFTHYMNSGAGGDH
jgi:RNA polymerase sigma factor (TIGR02999 family)